jgi:hypothetical protein
MKIYPNENFPRPLEKVIATAPHVIDIPTVERKNSTSLEIISAKLFFDDSSKKPLCYSEELLLNFAPRDSCPFCADI